MQLIFFIFMAFMPAFAFCAPLVSGVSGTVFDGQDITVTGENFGVTGPTVHFFDNFENGIAGNTINTGPASAVTGQWASLNTVPPVYSTRTAVSGMQAFEVTSQEGVEGQTNGVIALPDATETFISWWCYVPVNSPWSGEDTQLNWKIMWLMRYNSADNDLYFAQLIDSSTYVMGGNNSPLAYPDTEPWKSSHMKKGQWHRYWWWIRDGYSNDGFIKIWELTDNGVAQVKNVANKTTLFPLAVRKILCVNGYTREQTGIQSTQLFDDVYVSIGSCAQARCELGNTAAYQNCTNITVATVNTWSDKKIVATVRQGAFEEGESVYLFVVDSEGNYSSGYGPLNISREPIPLDMLTDSNIPSVPQGLTIR